MKLLSVALILISALSACTIVANRGPSSVFDEKDKAQKIQEIDLSLAQLSNEEFVLQRKREQLDKIDNKRLQDVSRLNKKLAKISSLVLEKQQEREALQKSLSFELSTKSWNGLGPLFDMQMKTGFGAKTEVLAVDALAGFEIGNPVAASFTIDAKAYSSYKLEVQNMLPSDTSGEIKEIAGRLECDGNIIYDEGFLIFKNEKRRKAYDFIWQIGRAIGQKLTVSFANEVSECRLLLKKKESAAWTHQIRLLTLEKLIPSAADFNQRLEVCARPVGFSEKDPVAFFWQQDFNQVSCASTFDKIEMLRDPIKAFNSKIRSLTGSNVPADAYRNKNPLVALRFGKVPQFDMIWVSSLSFSADFSGTVLSQALRYHADRGTQIRILIPEATSFKKDKDILTKLQRGRPNVKIQYYKYNFINGKDGSVVDRFHRVNHVKLLIGYSEKNPQNNFLVTGGRNIRDSYLFFETPKYTRYPWLIDYARGERPFIYYDDFEVELRGTEVVKSALSQILQFWNRDPESNYVRSTNLNISRPIDAAQVSSFYSLSQEKPLIRHVLSVPYSDKNQLEKFYVEMFDSAQKEIILTTPYFRPSKVISEAFSRAAKRGVRVRVLTRIELAGDDVPKVAEDVNKAGVNSHLKDLEMYEWVEPKSILHAKLLVIDQKLSFVSSVNMNSRSFTHDTESGVLILHEATAVALKKEVLRYFTQSQRLTEELRIKWLNGKLIDLFDSYF